MPIAMRAAITLWAVFLASWMAASAWSGRTAATPGGRRQAFYLLLHFGGWAMMFTPPGARFTPPVWSNPPAVAWALIALMAAGFLICWWARLHLGRLWSGGVTRKEDHRVVDTGPYRFVRHPIYTGLILASAAYAATSTTALAIAGVALSTFGFWIKAKLEERFLSEELGAEAYSAYKARTPMLVPFLPADTR
jgi:protein-S-isoprenylcysteine O-methyltransferase Ste14